ncbi:hypothetical protein J2T57_001732 [Natronocella acetinitrilica]|uniref:Uncharacterized protein n=1 Tax=Natronocella acetinitrilica TaxID=414046 RepID=A0AAE3KAQ1_9GAMM|nr:hypothetical protein [Natronocella acetinitrilica]MCP1674630.1 hypothetical protein [Natronocella acetinitrilica]
MERIKHGDPGSGFFRPSISHRHEPAGERFFLPGLYASRRRLCRITTLTLGLAIGRRRIELHFMHVKTR